MEERADRGRLIFFCKPPEPGQVKTRLGRSVGDEQAAALYSRMLRMVVSRFEAFAPLLYSGNADPKNLLAQLLPGLPAARPQRGETLGERMARAALAEYDSARPRPVAIAGTDIPELAPAHIEQAFAATESHDIVLGPTPDGGYYTIVFAPALLEQTATVHALFEGMRWSTERVLEDQVARATALGLRVFLLEPLADLDDVEDLLRFSRIASLQVPDMLPDIRVVMPVFNERDNLAYVLEPLFASGLFREVLCADNGSTDGSAQLARSLGARVTLCEERGYGATCLAGLSDIESRGGCDIVLFADGDGADHPEDAPLLLGPLLEDAADLVLGFRDPTTAERGALLPQARFGNWLATFLMRLVWRHRFRDLGPFRAIRWQALQALGMDDRNFGWTIQMQIRAIRAGLRIQERPVRYRRRHAGKSKVTANVRAIVRAGIIILWTIFGELRARRSD